MSRVGYKVVGGSALRSRQEEEEEDSWEEEEINGLPKKAMSKISNPWMDLQYTI